MKYIVAILLLSVATGARAGEEVNWRQRVNEAVCLLVGPFNAESVPEGKTLKQILDDFRPDLAEWSVVHSPAYQKKLGASFPKMPTPHVPTP